MYFGRNQSNENLISRMSDKAKIILEGKEHDLPVVTGSEKENAVDISKLRASTGTLHRPRI